MYGFYLKYHIFNEDLQHETLNISTDIAIISLTPSMSVTYVENIDVYHYLSMKSVKKVPTKLTDAPYKQYLACICN